MSRPVEWTGPATHDLERMDRTTAVRVRSAVHRFIETNYGDVRPLVGFRRQWRLRVGRWRVIFTYEEQTGALVVIRILPRGSAYRR